MQRLALLQGLRASHFTRPLSFPTYRAISTLQRTSPSTHIQLRKPSSSFALISLQFQQKRNTASSVSGRPASDDIPHAIQNAREEAKGVAKDVATIIAAANFDKRQHSYDGFVSHCDSFRDTLRSHRLPRAISHLVLPRRFQSRS